MISFPDHIPRFINHLILLTRPSTDRFYQKDNAIESNRYEEAEAHQLEHFFWFGIEKGQHDHGGNNCNDRVGLQKSERVQ